ncbi:MAG TPA: hypothetical protein VK923_16640 [Euzebyales bacterium]|nr:hypothetical protein [Euzebyales bacterium]
MSDEQPGHVGPRRTSRAFIHAAFVEGWEVEAIEPAELEITMPPGALRAWHPTIVRR